MHPFNPNINIFLNVNTRNNDSLNTSFSLLNSQTNLNQKGQNAKFHFQLKIIQQASSYL